MHSVHSPLSMPLLRSLCCCHNKQWMKKVLEELKERSATHNNQRAQIFSIINLFDGLPEAAFIRAHPNFMSHPTPLGYGRMRWQQHQQQQQQAQSLKITKRCYTWLIVEARGGSKWKSAVIVPLATLGRSPVGSITWAFYAFFNSTQLHLVACN